MGKTIKIGGVGKSPAIEKINQLNAVNSRIKAAAVLEQQIFCSEQEKARERLEKRAEIIRDFAINFQQKG